MRTLAAIGWFACLVTGASAQEAIDIAGCRQLFVDEHLIERTGGVELRLHAPCRSEPVLRFDRPWEGPFAAYVTVFQDGERYRMYYRGWNDLQQRDVTCYAESLDGIHWTKPNLGLFEWDGSRENNIVWNTGRSCHNFTPFKDARPGVPDDERYKALAYEPTGKRALIALVSSDGIRWRQLSDEPVLTQGAFDSQNLAFWDTNRQKYVSYFRIFSNGVRTIATAESEDFRTWSDPVPLQIAGPREHFYTNATVQYFRAPEYYFAFPKRFVPGRKQLTDHPERGISDAVFLTSRDGLHFERTFGEALLRPGQEERNWGDRSTMPAWGLVQTGPDEMSLYFSQHYRYDTHHLKRAVFRLDGIASAHAGAERGELVTRPLHFEGRRLVLNYATSAAGSVRVEIQDAAGKPLPGFTLDDAPEIYGDAIDEAYQWKAGSDVSSLAGEPIRLRFVMKECDLFSYRFEE